MINTNMLEGILGILPSGTEVFLRNHHLDDKPIVDVKVELIKEGKTSRIVLVLAEEPL